MSAIQGKIKTIPIDQPFLRLLAQYVAKTCAGSFPDLSNVLVVFPAQRNKLYFRRFLLESFDSTAMMPPTMMTVAELLDVSYEAAGGKSAMILHNVERNFLLKNVVDSLKVTFWKDLPFLRFIGVGDRLLDFFDELAKEQVTLERIEEIAYAGHYPERYITNELSVFKKIYHGYRKKLEEHGYHDAIDKHMSVYEHFHPEQFTRYSPVIIAGLLAQTVVEKKIITAMLRELPAELIVHSDHKKITEALDLDDPFYHHSRLVRTLGIKEVTTIGNGSVPPPIIHIRRLESISQQTLYVKDCISLALNRYVPSRIAVILTDESIVHTITETLDASGIDYNLSAGFVFTQSILFSFLSLLKDCAASRCHYKELVTFIKHPLVKNAIIDGKPLRPDVYGLEKRMVDQKINYFTKEEFETDFMSLASFIAECVTTVQARCSFSEYLQKIIDMLSRVLLYNQALVKQNRADVKDLIDELNTLARLRIEKKYLAGVDMFDFALSLVKKARFTSYGDPMKGIQVIGLLEARNLDFDCVIVPSLNEGVFPKRSEKDLFVNQAVRKEVGLPYDKERENLFYYYFTELTHGKKEVYLSYIEEKSRDVRSRFIDFLVQQNKTKVDQTKIALARATITHHKREVTKDAHLLSRLRTMLSGRGLSPTHLKDYRQCPYRFYLKYVLGIKEPERMVEEPGVLEWGRALHRALQNLYKYDVPNGYREDDLARVKALLDKRLDTAIRNEVARVPKRVLEFDVALYSKRMKQFLKSEARRFEQGYHVVTGKLEQRMKGSITVDDMEVKFFGFPDRVDQKDSKYYVIDYKSKAPAKKYYTVGSDFQEFQLPLYALMLSEGTADVIGGFGYYDLSTIMDYVTVADEETVREYLDDFQKQVLVPVVTELLNPDVRFYQTSEHDACQYCSFFCICGVTDV